MEQRNRKRDKKNAKRNLKWDKYFDVDNIAISHKKLIALELVSKAAELNSLYRKAKELGLKVEGTTSILSSKTAFSKDEFLLSIEVYEKIV